MSKDESRNSAKRPRLKALRLMKPGGTTDEHILSDPQALSYWYAIHAHTSWLFELDEHLQTNKKAAHEGAGNNGRKIIHIHMDGMVINSVVESFSDKPNFAIMPIFWWHGFAVDDSNLIDEVFVKTEKRELLPAYVCSQVLGPLWADRSVVHNDSGLGIQFNSPIHLIMGISHPFNKTLLENISDFEKQGINLKEEPTGDMLITMDSDGAFSALTATCNRASSLGGMILVTVRCHWERMRCQFLTKVC